MKECSDICTAFIPSAIIDHLWTIVDIYGEDSYVFVLSSRRLGDTLVQDIKIILGSSTYLHSVYGFAPVNFTIKVARRDDGYRMTMIPSAKAAHEIDKWTRRKPGHSFLRKLSSSPQSFRVRRAW